MSFNLFKRSSLCSSLLLASVVFTPYAHADQDDVHLQKTIDAQQAKIAQLNNELLTIKQQQLKKEKMLLERLNRLETIAGIESKTFTPKPVVKKPKIKTNDARLNTNIENVKIIEVVSKNAQPENTVKKKATKTAVKNNKAINFTNFTPKLPSDPIVTKKPIVTKNPVLAKPKPIKVKKAYIQAEDTPESELISVSPEELFKARFQKKLEVSTNPADTYLKGLKAFSNNDIETAIYQFKRFNHYHPNHSLAPKAHYWLGMAYIKQVPANYSSARFEFMEVVDRYEFFKTNDKRSKAIYRLAQLSKINNYDQEVKKYVEMLATSYPKSEEYKMAQKLLKK